MEAVSDYLSKKRNVQCALLSLIKDDENMEENMQNLSQIIADQQICEDKYQLRDFLYLVSNISNNHYRSNTFFEKIQRVLQDLMKEINEFFNESEIYDIFQKNKRILLFLFDEKILTANQHLANRLMKDDENNCLYFYNEIKDFIKIPNIENSPILQSEDYDENRDIGENDSQICQIIRNDSIEELESYIKESEISLNSMIETSIFETNPFLIGKEITLIEYAAFCGSHEILKYLLNNNVQISSELWIYSIHSKNLDIFNFLKENNVYLDFTMHEKLLEESIKCHHNEITNYLLTNYIDKEEFSMSNIVEQKFIDASFHYYNYAFFPEELIDNSILQSLIKYNHFHLFKLLYEADKINIKKAYNIAKKEENQDVMKFLSSISSDIFDKKPFPVWEQNSNGQIKLTEVAKKRFSLSFYPCMVLVFGGLRSGKSTISSHLLNGAKSDYSNSTFKVSGCADSCTHRINAVGPVKCKEIASLFDINININEYDEDNKNRDIFIIDSEGLFAVKGEIKWLKQAICSMISLVNVSFYASKSFDTIYLNDFMKYSSIIQTFENINVHHGFSFINNLAIIDGDNVLQKLSEQNKTTTEDLVHDLSFKYPGIDASMFKCFSVFEFHSRPKEYRNSLSHVASFIMDLCLSKGTKISGSLLADSFERFANEIDDIYSNINNEETMDEMAKIFKCAINDEMIKLIKKQEKDIQNDIASKVSLIPFGNTDHLNIDAAITKLEKGKDLDKIIDKTIKEIFPDSKDFIPLVEDSTITYIKDIAKNTIHKIKMEEIQRRQKIMEEIENIKKQLREQGADIQQIKAQMKNK